MNTLQTCYLTEKVTNSCNEDAKAKKQRRRAQKRYNFCEAPTSYRKHRCEILSDIFKSNCAAKVSLERVELD